jgi:transposase
LPQIFGNWQVIAVRLNRWAEKGLLERVFKVLAGKRLPVSGVCSFNSRMVKTHPDAHGPEKTVSKG